MAIRNKTATNKWTYERSHKSLNSYSLVEYNKIYPNTNSWKALQEQSSWQERLWQPIFLKHFKQYSSRHLSVKHKYKRLHTINKKHVHKERKETTHEEMGETIITTSIYINIKNEYKVCYHNVRTTYLKSKEKKRYKKSSLHPSKRINIPPNKNLLY